MTKYFMVCIFLIQQNLMKKYENQFLSVSFPESWNISFENKDSVVFNIDEFSSFNILTQDVFFDLSSYSKLSFEQIKKISGTEIISYNDIDISEMKGKSIVYKVAKNEELGIYSDLKLKQVWAVLKGKAFLLTYTSKESTYNNSVEEINKLLNSFQFL